MTRQQREDIVNAIQRGIALDAAIPALQQTANDLEAFAALLQASKGANIRLWVESLQSARDAYQATVHQALERRDNWAQVLNIQIGLPDSGDTLQVSLDDVTAKRDNAETEALTTFQANVDRVQNLFEPYPVPQDASGRRRIPQDWVEPYRDTAAQTIRRNAEAHDPKSIPDILKAGRNAVWQPNATWNGCNGFATLWLLVDADTNAIVDVSPRKLVPLIFAKTSQNSESSRKIAIWVPTGTIS